MLHVFGCACYPFLRPYSLSKLSPHSKLCVFIDYCSCSKGYRCLDPSTNHVYTSRHVTFQDSSFPFSLIPSSSFPSSSNPFSLHPTTFLPSHTSSLLSSPPYSISPSSPTFSNSSSVSAPLHSLHPSSVSPSSSSSTSTSSSASLASYLVSSTSGHPMTTRLKSGSMKPRHILSLFGPTISPPTTEPSTYSEASISSLASCYAR